MKYLHITLFIALTMAIMIPQARANKQRPRSLEEMQTQSAIVMDGELTKVNVVKTEYTPNPGGETLASHVYQATFKVHRSIKGKITKETVELVYARTEDSRFRGDNPPLLKIGDRFRLFVDEYELEDDLTIIRVRSSNAIRTEGYEWSSGRPKATSLDSSESPTPLLIEKLAFSAPPTPDEQTTPIPPVATHSQKLTPAPSPTAANPKFIPWPWIIGAILFVVVLSVIRFKFQRK